MDTNLKKYLDMVGMEGEMMKQQEEEIRILIQRHLCNKIKKLADAIKHRDYDPEHQHATYKQMRVTMNELYNWMREED